MPLVNLPPGVRMTPALLKQIMEECGTCNPCNGSGSGSGSGSGDGSGSGGSGSGGGGLGDCCTCTVFPDELTITIDVGCLGSQTFTLFRGQTNLDCATPESPINVEYSGGVTGTIDEGSFSDTNCQTGAGVISSSAVNGTYSAFLYCIRCNETAPYSYLWGINVSVQRIAGGTHQGLVEYVNEIADPTSCVPMVFPTVSKTVVCIDDRTAGTTCNNFGSAYNEPWVGYDYCVGSSFTIDISE